MRNDTQNPIHKALALSEIRSHIGYFLIGSNKDLITCMLVCKQWRQDFRRLLYLHLDLTPNRHSNSVAILPMQWRAFGPYTQSLAIKEPAISNRGVMGQLKRGKLPGSSDPKFVQSIDYNLDPASHCPNLLHLTIKIDPKLVSFCCWNKQDHARDDDDDDDDDDGDDGASAYSSTTAVTCDSRMEMFFIKTSNRVQALLHRHPQLQSFRWIGISEAHMDHLGRYFLSTLHHTQLAELHLEHLITSVPELNRIIANLPSLRTLYLRTLFLESTPKWPDLSSSTEDEMSVLSLSEPPSLETPPSPEAPPSLHQQSSIVLDLQGIRHLTLIRPRFPLLHLIILGPALQQLYLAECQFPPGFDHLTGSQNAGSIPTSTTETSTSAFSVHWTCPQLKVFTHDKAPVQPMVFTHNLLDSSQSTLHSLSFTSYNLEAMFVSDMISHNHCKILTHLDLTNSAWIKSASVQLLLCHCPELIDFTGPQGVLWGEDMAQSPLSWACLKLKRLRLLICLARPDSEMWEQNLKDPRQLHGGRIQSDHVPLGFPLQEVLGAGNEASRLQGSLTGIVTGGDDVDDEDVDEDDVDVEGAHGPTVRSTSDSIWLRDVQNVVLDQLAKLTQLELLDLSGGFSTFHFLVEYPRGVPWTLDAGLDRLRGLSKMRELIVTGWEDKMRRPEAKWMKQFWPDLRSIVNRSGNLTRGFMRMKGSKANEEFAVGWMAFEICLAQEWPERFAGTWSPEDLALGRL
ncbi:hypothetical protein BG011_004575 [Mortierella polycephala]|uniref:F-box domain-containing protein n=1 Tax=Mortierella polycephala TaxID=41804 RepID=A0A9P6U261_9FUNG|nr:hypothetical protein BG011_004575 [Mortierella polycephala]